MAYSGGTKNTRNYIRRNLARMAQGGGRPGRQARGFAAKLAV